MRTLAAGLAGLFLILTVSGCASTVLVSSQRAAGAPVKSYGTLLVVGLSESAATRQVFEEIFADELRKRGVGAVSSYSLAGLKGKASRAAFAEALKQVSADGMLTTRFVGVKKRKDTKTGYVMTDRGVDIVDYYDYYGYYGDYWEGVENYATFDSKPVDEILSSVTTLETSLFDAGTGKVVWTGKSDENHSEKLIQSTRELAGLVLDALAGEGFIRSK